jgi:ketosteroid isomerase-like protein
VAADAPCMDVRDLEREWRDALVEKDEAALRRLIHPQYKLVGIRSTGSVAVNLEQWIEALKRMDIASLEVRVTECVALDNVIVATVDAQWQVRYLGQVIDERVLLTDVWVREGDSWKVVRRHSSPVPQGVKITDS